MRSSVLDKIKGLALNQVKLSTELPFDESGTPRYTKNPKTIYVDRDSVTTTNLIQTLDVSVNLNQETTSVRIYFTTDAKNPLLQYDTIVSQLRGLKDTIQLAGAVSKESDVITTYDDDMLITEVEYRLTKLA